MWNLFFLRLWAHSLTTVLRHLWYFSQQNLKTCKALPWKINRKLWGEAKDKKWPPSVSNTTTGKLAIFEALSLLPTNVLMIKTTLLLTLFTVKNRNTLPEKNPDLTVLTVFENHRKSLIQHCERSGPRLHFEGTNVNWKCRKWSILASFWKPEACGQTVLPDRSVLIGQKLVKNDKT